MANRTDTWFPFYIAAYVADTMRLTTTGHGAYLLLLMEYWRQGPLPDDDNELAAITKLSKREWTREIGPIVRRFFTLESDGKLHQKRMDAERQKAKELSGKRSLAAKQRGTKDQQLLSNSTPVAGDLQPSLSREPSTSTDTELRSEVAQQAAPVAAPEPDCKAAGVSQTKRGTRLPTGWEPAPDLITYCRELGVDPKRAAEDFRDFWQARAGANAVKLDWGLTFKSSCRRLAEQRRFPLPAHERPAADPRVFKVVGNGF